MRRMCWRSILSVTGARASPPSCRRALLHFLAEAVNVPIRRFAFEAKAAHSVLERMAGVTGELILRLALIRLGWMRPQWRVDFAGRAVDLTFGHEVQAHDFGAWLGRAEISRMTRIGWLSFARMTITARVRPISRREPGLGMRAFGRICRPPEPSYPVVPNRAARIGVPGMSLVAVAAAFRTTLFFI